MNLGKDNKADVTVTEVLDEYFIRKRSGEDPNINEYLVRYPEYADQIKKAFSAQQYGDFLFKPLSGIAEGVISNRRSNVIWQNIRRHINEETEGLFNQAGSFKKLLHRARQNEGRAIEAVNIIGKRIAKAISHLPRASCSLTLPYSAMFFVGRVRLGSMPVSELSSNIGQRGKSVKMLGQFPESDEFELDILYWHLTDKHLLKMRLNAPADVSKTSNKEPVTIILKYDEEKFVLGDYFLQNGQIQFELNLKI